MSCIPLQGKYIESLPMILFGAFALCAAALVFFLPETYNRELPDHIADAVKIKREEDSSSSESEGK